MLRYIFILSLLFHLFPVVAMNTLPPMDTLAPIDTLGTLAAPPKHEVRAAWLTAVYGLDWPRTKATTPATIRRQKEELIDILDKLKAANFNTVLFQTARAETYYIHQP